MIRRTIYIPSDDPGAVVDALTSARAEGIELAERTNDNVLVTLKKRIGKLSQRVAEIYIHKPR